MEKSDYNFGDKLLHRLALGIPAITRASFELDSTSTLPQTGPSAHKHVFISGLARAGTTILMRTFHDTDQFRSLTYRDMPFVLMPNTWKKFSKHFYKTMENKERAHGDGILVSFDSPEAFEEVFWRAYCAKDYIFNNCLRPHPVSSEGLDRFRSYTGRIIDSADDRTQQRYLSKNNNNILRLGAIRKAFPDSLIIVPFRDPVQHAFSLLNQHRKFCEKHAQDKFSYSYMQWLGHHEFGLTHKPFLFEENDISSLSMHDPGNINYWLTIWINTYRYLEKNAPENSHFVSFETLCNKPVETMRRLFDSAGLSLNEEQIKSTIKPPRTIAVEGVDKNLEMQALEISAKLQSEK